MEMYQIEVPPQSPGKESSEAFDPEQIPSQEFVLKSSDQKKSMSQLDELVKRFGGETLTAEGNAFLISLPGSSLADFRKELEGIQAPAKIQEVVPPRAGMGGGSAEDVAKRSEIREKDKEVERLDAIRETRVLVRVVVVEE